MCRHDVAPQRKTIPSDIPTLLNPRFNRRPRHFHHRQSPLPFPNPNGCLEVTGVWPKPGSSIQVLIRHLHLILLRGL